MRILLINLPPYLPKKTGNSLYWLQASLNLGALAVASSAIESGHEVRFLDWLGPQQIDLDHAFTGIVTESAPDIIGFSMPSGYAEPYLGSFSARAKEIMPDCRVLVGGQYHAGFRARQILDRFPGVDLVCIGSGEAVDWDRLHVADPSELASMGLVTRGSSPSPERHTSLVAPNFRWEAHLLDLRGYAPKIELGRGCPFHCQFCALSGAPARLSSNLQQSVQRQLQFWCELWSGERTIPLYAECPVFFCNSRSIAQLENCFNPFSETVRWRTQARVDSVEPGIMPRLYRQGLRIIDLGLESASEEMLQLMQKTANPKRYLQAADTFIRAAADAGIGVKLNILLYAGETEATSADTEEFIMQHHNRLAGISAGPAILFPGTALEARINEFSQRFATSKVELPELAQAGIFPLHLSRDFSYEQARAWCLRLSRAAMTEEQYYAHKRIGYYPPTLDVLRFHEAVTMADRHQLPFGPPPEAGGQHADADGWEAVVRWDWLR